MLSKSKYIKALQCEKRLWMDKHQPENKDELSEAQQAIFARGISVGELAMELFPEGKDASQSDEDQMNFPLWLSKTKRYVGNHQKVIFEAAFSAGGSFAAMDILLREGDGWRAIEVKSSTGVHEYHLNDAALQYHVLKSAGLNIIDIEIMHLNNNYIREGQLDLHQLFTRTSVLEHVLPLQAEMPQKLKHFREVLKQPDVPHVNIGPHCSQPFSCDFIGHCWQHIPENNVFQLSRIGEKAWDLHERGIYAQKDIPQDYPLSENNRIHLEAQKSGEGVFDKLALSGFLNTWQYPLYFFDFETVGPAVPIFDGTKPYMHFPFQYSLHILERPDAELIHKEFLPNPNGDPRPALVQQLIDDLGKKGSIITYNMSFEKGKIQQLAAYFPQHEDVLMAINERIVDLIVPFRNMWVYDAEMKGSASIKAVLPALLPYYSYADLNISDGGTASETYLAMLEGRFEGDQEATLKDLKAYCKLDTLAMVEIYKYLVRRLKD